MAQSSKKPAKKKTAQKKAPAKRSVASKQAVDRQLTRMLAVIFTALSLVFLTIVVHNYN